MQISMAENSNAVIIAFYISQPIAKSNAMLALIL